jgi:hypothetical protein
MYQSRTAGTFMYQLQVCRNQKSSEKAELLKFEIVKGTSPLSDLKKPPVSTFLKKTRAVVQKTRAEAGWLPKTLQSKSRFSPYKTGVTLIF